MSNSGNKKLSARHPLDPRGQNNKYKQLSPNAEFDYAFYSIVRELEENGQEFTVEAIVPEEEFDSETKAQVYENGIYGARFSFGGKCLVLMSPASDALIEGERNQGATFLPKILRRVRKLQEEEKKLQQADSKEIAQTQYVIPLAEARRKLRRHWVQLHIEGNDTHLNDPKVYNQSLAKIWNYPLNSIRKFISRLGFREFDKERYLGLQHISDFNYCAFYVAFATKDLVRTLCSRTLMRQDGEEAGPAFFEKDFRDCCEQLYQSKQKHYDACIRSNKLIQRTRKGKLPIKPLHDLEVDEEPWVDLGATVENVPEHKESILGEKEKAAQEDESAKSAAPFVYSPKYDRKLKAILTPRRVELERKRYSQSLVVPLSFWQRNKGKILLVGLCCAYFAGIFALPTFLSMDAIANLTQAAKVGVGALTVPLGGGVGAAVSALLCKACECCGCIGDHDATPRPPREGRSRRSTHALSLSPPSLVKSPLSSPAQAQQLLDAKKPRSDSEDNVDLSDESVLAELPTVDSDAEDEHQHDGQKDKRLPEQGKEQVGVALGHAATLLVVPTVAASSIRVSRS